MKASIIGKSFEPIFGQPCWGLNHERYLNLSLNFGTPSLRVREPLPNHSKSAALSQLAARRLVTVRGEWWLWLWCCHWQLSQNGERLATGSSSPRRIDQSLKILAGQRLISADVRSNTGKTRFAFDLGACLECRRFDQKREESLWSLYKPKGYVLSVWNNGRFSHDRGSTHQERLRPIPDQG